MASVAPRELGDPHRLGLVDLGAREHDAPRIEDHLRRLAVELQVEHVLLRR